MPSPEENRLQSIVGETLPGPLACWSFVGSPPMKTIHLDRTQLEDLRRRCKQTLDKRIYQRLTAVLLMDASRSRAEVADILHVSLRQVADWLRLFRNQGVEVL